MACPASGAKRDALRLAPMRLLASLDRRMRHRSSLGLVALTCLVAACGGDPTGPSSGSLAVSVSGLPAGAAGSIHVSGPGGFSRDLSTTTTLSGLAPGGYVVAASTVQAGGDTYAPSPPTQTITVSGSGA